MIKLKEYLRIMSDNYSPIRIERLNEDKNMEIYEIDSHKVLLYEDFIPKEFMERNIIVTSYTYFGLSIVVE